MEIIPKCHYTFFLEKHKAENYCDVVADLVQSYKSMGCNTCMSLKMSFLDSHLDFLPENLGAVSDEHRERFHQDTSITSTERGAKAGEFPVCWLIIAGHLEENLNRQNGTESNSLLHVR
jgi:hypothetical protein